MDKKKDATLEIARNLSELLKEKAEKEKYNRIQEIRQKVKNGGF